MLILFEQETSRNCIFGLRFFINQKQAEYSTEKCILGEC